MQWKNISETGPRLSTTLFWLNYSHQCMVLTKVNEALCHSCPQTAPTYAPVGNSCVWANQTPGHNANSSSFFDSDWHDRMVADVTPRAGHQGFTNCHYHPKLFIIACFFPYPGNEYTIGYKLCHLDATIYEASHIVRYNYELDTG